MKTLTFMKKSLMLLALIAFIGCGKNRGTSNNVLSNGFSTYDLATLPNNFTPVGNWVGVTNLGSNNLCGVITDTNGLGTIYLRGSIGDSEQVEDFVVRTNMFDISPWIRDPRILSLGIRTLGGLMNFFRNNPFEALFKTHLGNATTGDVEERSLVCFKGIDDLSRLNSTLGNLGLAIFGVATGNANAITQVSQSLFNSISLNGARPFIAHAINLDIEEEI